MPTQGCPCGFYNHPKTECKCGAGNVQKYLSKISGPLFDRIDIHVEVVPVPFRELSDARPAEKSEVIRSRVTEARQIQAKRFEGMQGIYCNAQMPVKILRKYCQLDDASNLLLKNAMDKLGLSARAFDRILKVSRTIADIDKQPRIQAEHLAEAIQYRSLDRDNWGK
jgi:magnesium chelatase family protein